MLAATKIYVDLNKYVDDTVEHPIIVDSDVTVATVAYRALAGSWGLNELAYQFGLKDVEVLAALLYYDQFSERIDMQQENEPVFEALD